MSEKRYDVVIVGAGIVGSILALEAAEAGRTVLVLEAGTDQARSFSGYQEQLHTFYGAFYKTPEAPYPFNPNSPQPDIPTVPTAGAKYFVETGSALYGSTYARTAGGTTLHWLGTCLRMLPEDFEVKSRFGVGLDWPLSYADLQRDYELAEREIGVSADVADQQYLGITFRDGYDFPMRRIPLSYSDQWLGERIDGMTVEIGGEDREIYVRSTPQGRNSTPRGDYKPVGAVDDSPGFGPVTAGTAVVRNLGERCQGNSACVPICPVQAKYNALKTLTKAVATGRVEVMSQAVASRVCTQGRQVTGIEYLRYPSPLSPAATTGIARGDVYVLACHAVENAKLMLMSGLQSENGLVGAYLQDHPVQLTWGLAPEQVGSYRGPLSTSGIEDLRGGSFRQQHGAFRIEIGNDGWIWPMGAPDTTAAEAVDGGLIGRSLREALRDEVGRQLRMGCLIEQLPVAENRVSIDRTNRDALGLPRPVVNYSLDSYVVDGMRVSAATVRKIFAAAGIEDRTDPEKSFCFKLQRGSETFVWGGAGHYAGTHCMGDDPAASVVDPNQRSWEHDNLYLAGAGSMPTMGTANPTITVAALAYRTARNLFDGGRGRDGDGS